RRDRHGRTLLTRAGRYPRTRPRRQRAEPELRPLSLRCIVWWGRPPERETHGLRLAPCVSASPSGTLIGHPTYSAQAMWVSELRSAAMLRQEDHGRVRVLTLD